MCWILFVSVNVQNTFIEKKKSFFTSTNKNFSFIPEQTKVLFWIGQFTTEGMFNISSTVSLNLVFYLRHCVCTVISFPEYGQLIVRIWSDYCQNMVSLLSEYGQIIVRIWSDYCQNMVSLLSEYCQIIVRILSAYCQNMVGLLSEYCQNIVRLLSECIFKYMLRVRQMFPSINWNLNKLITSLLILNSTRYFHV